MKDLTFFLVICLGVIFACGRSYAHALVVSQFMNSLDTAPFLELSGLSAQYGKTLAVNHVSLRVARGELVSLLGPSGCGKTTTLRMVAGLIKPSAGRIMADGQDITALPAHQRSMGVVFQSYALFPHLSVLENVGFGLRMRSMPAKQRQEKAHQALSLVNLSALANRYPGELSGGQQQRVALARALVIEPRVLLLDEPLSNLDMHLRADMRNEIRRLQQSLSITTLFVTHDQAEALAISDRVAIMSHGQLIEVDTPQRLCDQPGYAQSAAFLGARTVVTGHSNQGIFTAKGLTCHGAPEGATAIVLRAARLRLEGNDSAAVVGALTLQGSLAAVSYLGDTLELDVQTDAGTVRVLAPSDTQLPSLGATCRVSALPSGVSFVSS